MALSRVQYTGTGTSALYSIPFPYISKAYIEVRVGGTQLFEGAGYTWQSATSINLTAGNLATGVVLDIRRVTPKASKLVDFQDGSVLTEAALDLSADQVFQLVQETVDDMADRLAVQPDGTVDMQSRRLKNVADPVAAQDAVTLNHANLYLGGMAATYAEQAQASALDAANSAALISTSGLLVKSQNLADLQSASIARGNLGLGTGSINGPSGAVVLDATGKLPAVGGDSLSGVVHLSGAETINGQKTFSAMPSITGVSCVRVRTANGYGSTNVAIRRFSTVVDNIGADISYADSASLGASFTVNTAGIYTVSFCDQFNTSGWLGVTLNTTAPAAGLPSGPPASEVLAQAYTSTNTANGCVSWTGYLPAGAVLRPHCGGSPSGTSPTTSTMTVARVA